MIRSVVWATALGLLMSGLPAEAADPPKDAATPSGAAAAAPPPAAPAEAAAPAAPAKAKKSRRARKGGGGGKHHAHGGSITQAQANSPFADVPKDHWAYEAVSKAVESGLLQGYSNRFYGGRPMTRYQMAVVVARMLDRLHVLKANGRMFTAQDIANLEALTIEFADELSLLNVKVSTLEEQVSVLRKNVDTLKYDLGVGGPRSPLTGVIAARSVFTSSGRPGYGQTALLVSPVSAATPSLLRYRGDNTGPGRAMGPTAPGNIGNPFDFDSREFATVAQFSLNLDRQVTRDIEFHMQLDFDAESRDTVRGDANTVFAPGQLGILGNNATPVRQVAAGIPAGSSASPLIFGSGRGQSFNGSPVHVNQAYIHFNSWLGDSDALSGVFATPFNVENNGPSRTYNWTLTPSAANTFWEGLRPTGVEFRNGRKEDYWLWNLGVFANLDGSASQNAAQAGQRSLSGGATLLSGVQITDGTGGPKDPFGNTTASANVGRFPTPRLQAMSDAPRGVDGALETEDLGFYFRLGGQNRDNLGFGWQIGYIDNGGDIRPSGGTNGSSSDWYAWQGEVDYKWKRWMILAQYYHGRTRNFTEAELNTASAAFDNRNMGNRGSPFPNVFAEDTSSDSIMGLVTYAWNKENSLTLRYEDADDETGPALIGGQFWTMGYNRRMSDKSLLQIEYVTVDSRTRSDRRIINAVDISDDVAQVNYRLQF